ncbi:hypothetical protein [Cnuibacter physcomitrellae]|uniref:hypothetical protein n=1 Tax=Cnuibacter physcomitrellae TaxID=1619308 RepID=UPI0012F4C9D0|nr:hypothetical protein [Cnuibacter physcomitrellae]
MAVFAVTMATISAAEPASAADYPTWAEVEAARDDEATKQQQISTLNGLITTLEGDGA